MNKIIYFIFALLICSVSFADKNMKIGSKGKSSDVTRTITVKMYDNYYEPNTFNIKKGETVKFEVKNLGELVHEFNIANPMMHIKHQPEMELRVENEILLGDRIDKDKIVPEAHVFDDLNFDSLDSVQVVLEIEKEFDIEATDDEIDSIQTVQDIIDLVENLS